jgi:hypothetical protein
MTINEFIQKAADGGYKFRGDKLLYDDQVDQWCVRDGNGGYFIPCVEAIFLDPDAWRALGKNEKVENDVIEYWTVLSMRGMINALCDGKSLEEYIATL